jgi:O-antigen ligase
MSVFLLGVAAALGVLVLVGSSRRPLRTIVPVYAFLVPIGGVFALRVPLPSPFNTLSSLTGALAIGAVSLHLVRERRGRIPTLPVGMWLAFVGWSAFTFVWAGDPAPVVHELTIAIPLVALLVLVALLPGTREDLMRLRDAVVLSGAAVGGYGLLLMTTGAALPAHGFSSRFSLSAGDTNPNQLAASLLLPLALSIDLALGEREIIAPWWRRWLGPVGAVLSAFAIALSGSRGGALAAVVGAVTVLVLFARWRPWQRFRVRRAVRGVAAGSVALIVLAVISLSLFPESRLSSLFESDPVQRLVETETGSSGRAEIWTTGALACREHCAVGAGLGNFTRVYTEVFAFSNVSRNVGLERPGHNLYLEIAVETGLVGIVLFFLAIGAEWRTIRSARTFPLAAGIAAGVVALLVADVFEGFLWFKHAWLPFVMIRVFEAAAAGSEPVARATVHDLRLPPSSEVARA